MSALWPRLWTANPEGFGARSAPLFSVLSKAYVRRTTFHLLLLPQVLTMKDNQLDACRLRSTFLSDEVQQTSLPLAFRRGQNPGSLGDDKTQ